MVNDGRKNCRVAGMSSNQMVPQTEKNLSAGAEGATERAKREMAAIKTYCQSVIRQLCFWKSLTPSHRLNEVCRFVMSGAPGCSLFDLERVLLRPTW